jgi:hypothetical protein
MGTAGSAGASAPLQDAAVRDPYALVRQAALESLSVFDAGAAHAVAAQMATNDPEPRLRDAARAVAR